MSTITNGNFEMELNENFGHRLHDKFTGEVTQWCAKRSFTYLNGMVSFVTFDGTVNTPQILPAVQFCETVGVGK